MVFSNDAIFSLLTGILAFACALNPTAAETSLQDSVCGDFAVHAGSAITFAGTEVIGGDIGCDVAGITGGVVNFVNEYESTGASFYPESVIAAWDAEMLPRDCAKDMAIEIGGKTFTPGTYRSGTINIIAGATVILDGQYRANPVFLFQAGSTMLTGAGCKIILINGATAENVLWAIGTAFTTGVNSEFRGSIVAGSAITIAANNKVYGSVVAGSAITFGANVEIKGCVAANSAITFGAKCSVNATRPASSCRDVSLWRKIGVTSFTEMPITISQSITPAKDKVSFHIAQNWTNDSYLFARFKDKESDYPTCTNLGTQKANWKSDALTAFCSKFSKTAIVDIWVANDSFDMGSDVAKLPSECLQGDLPPTHWPMVKYAFQVECSESCPESCPTTGRMLGSEL
jgi:hypothetical protein